MKILLLGTQTRCLLPALGGHDLRESVEPLHPARVELWRPDWIISFNYRHILSPEVLQLVRGKAINIHISLLPWNRGSDPNFWSWVENSPKGISIHRMAKGIDTGRIIAQEEVFFGSGETLRSSYVKLIETSKRVFSKTWPQIELGTFSEIQQDGRGSYHRTRDLEPHRHLLVNGWDTSCNLLCEYGQENGLWVNL
jgi:methionyl-tRNA formyltransferase